MATLEEESPIAGCLADEGVGGGVADDVGLGLDDPAAEASGVDIVDEELADQEARQLGGVDRQRRARQPGRSRGGIEHGTGIWPRLLRELLPWQGFITSR